MSILFVYRKLNKNLQDFPIVLHNVLAVALLTQKPITQKPYTEIVCIRSTYKSLVKTGDHYKIKANPWAYFEYQNSSLGHLIRSLSTSHIIFRLQGVQRSSLSWNKALQNKSVKTSSAIPCNMTLYGWHLHMKKHAVLQGQPLALVLNTTYIEEIRCLLRQEHEEQERNFLNLLHAYSRTSGCEILYNLFLW